MGVYLSPGVYLREIDLSVLPNQVGPLRPAFIGTANKGPLNVPTFISTAEQYIDTFGEPFSDSYLGYAVLAFMEEGNQCYVLRVGVECEVGQETDLADVCIDSSGAKVEGWGRIPLFSGIAFGKICTRDISADAPLVFHDDSITDIEFTDVDVSSTDGETVATLDFAAPGSDDYTGAIDDSFVILITSDPTASAGNEMDGAEYQVTRNSDGEIIGSGTIVESGVPGRSVPIPIGSGDDDSGLDAIIVVTGASPLEEGDYFTFNVAPNNLTFAFSVEGGIAADYILGAGSYTDPQDFADDVNTLIGLGEDYIATVVGDTVCFRTDVSGSRIQITNTEAFALEIGVSLYAYDIVRSHVVGIEPGPYAISDANNRVRILIIGSEESVATEVSVPNNLTATPLTVAPVLQSAGVISGERYFQSYALQVTDDDYYLIIETSDLHEFDQLKLEASTSHIRTLRFAETIGVGYPYTIPYEGFDDARVEMPEAGTISPATPASCEADPASAQCALDTAYYANIVGFLVATSAGTWIDEFLTTVEIFNDEPGKYTLKMADSNGVQVDRIDDISFDPVNDRYIANIINPGSTLGGTNGNSFVNWEERPSYLGNDPINDPLDLEIREPAQIFSEAFVGSENGIPLDATLSSELDRFIIGNPAESTGLFAFQNPETFDINLLIIPGNTSGSVIGQALQLCESRGDMMAIFDPPFGLKPQQVVDWHNGMLTSSLAQAINSSYGALYWSWLRIFDQFSGDELFVPPSGHVSSVYARTSRVAEQWFAPAGTNRGRLLTPLDVEYDPTLGERDLLYGSGNSVNPIVNFTQQGITVWGQRTLQRHASALDRVNVRMLLIFIKKSLVRLYRQFVFEPNDEFLWRQVVNTTNPFLSDIQARRGLTAFKVVCDETNNTPERIDRNELWISIFLKPTRTAEFIVVNLVVLRTEQSFSASEVLVAGGVVVA